MQYHTERPGLHVPQAHAQLLSYYRIAREFSYLSSHIFVIVRRKTISANRKRLEIVP